MENNRFDRITRAAGTRRTFVAALAAVAVGLFRVRSAGAQGMCSSVGGVCVPGMSCCPGHLCTFEYNTWVGRCARINDEEGGTYPLDTAAAAWADRIVSRGAFVNARLQRRREERRRRRRHNRRH